MCQSAAPNRDPIQSFADALAKNNDEWFYFFIALKAPLGAVRR